MIAEIVAKLARHIASLFIASPIRRPTTNHNFGWAGLATSGTCVDGAGPHLEIGRPPYRR
jgi:hypothetical protein